MSKIEFSQKEKALLVLKIQKYFDNELAQELEQFDAEFLIDFISDELGAYYYNKGLDDAQIVLASKIDTISEAISEIEQPTAYFK
jgi:uncharacterized protein (DUF2164 family)